MDETRRTVHLTITGRVQRVWYRGWLTETATRLGLDGWVRNRADGSVEAVVAGPHDQVATVIDACRDGPPSARVLDVSVSDTDETPPSGFRQRSTL